MKLLKQTVLVLLLVMAAAPMKAQIGVKTTLIGWGTTTTNLGVEVGVGKHSTLQAMGYLNPWDFSDNRHFRFWMAQPEYRYWFCGKFNGHFIGVHALGGQYNAMKINFPLQMLMWGETAESNPAFPESDHGNGWPDLTGANAGRHVEGWFAGAGITYGYQWILSKHWNLEASIGVGYAYSPLTYYGRCQQVIDKRKLHYVGPTNAQISFMYVF